MNLNTLTPPRCWPTPGRLMRTGRIGIDLGTHAIKCVQLRRAAGQWKLASFRILEPDHAWPVDAPQSSLLDVVEQTLRRCPGLRRLFRGRRAACVLPMSLVEQRLLHMPAAARDEMHDLIREELAAAEPADSYEFDWWPSDDPALGSASGQVRVSIVSTRTQTAADVATLLAKSGFDCDVLDAMPTTLGRAASLAAGSRQHAPVGMLDLGCQTPLLTCVVDGTPVFSRLMPHCGLQRLHGAVCSALGISAAECRLLLERYQIVSPDDADSELASTIYWSGAAWLKQLIEQLEQTLHYVHQHYGYAAPGRLWLCGGGATLPGLARWLAEQLSMPVEHWSLGPAIALAEGDPQPLLAAAAALSLAAEAN